MFVLPNKVFCALLVMACLLLLSCDLIFKKEKSPVIAEVGDSRLSINELKEKEKGDSVSKDEWASRVEHWVNFEVMYREAVKRGLQKDPDAKKLIKDAEKKILVDRLRLSVYNATGIESDDEMQEYYEKNRELFRIDSTEFIPFSEVKNQIRRVILSEKRLAKEKQWLSEIKNNYSIEVYPQYLDSL